MCILHAVSGRIDVHCHCLFSKNESFTGGAGEPLYQTFAFSKIHMFLMTVGISLLLDDEFGRDCQGVGS